MRKRGANRRKREEEVEIRVENGNLFLRTLLETSDTKLGALLVRLLSSDRRQRNESVRLHSVLFDISSSTLSTTKKDQYTAAEKRRRLEKRLTLALNSPPT